jgi:2-dehydro-3-deoxyphosphooctonate aldolase (KDO 8-P synthase)
MSFRLIAGPCVIENRDLVLQIAEEVSGLCSKLGITFVSKPVSSVLI